MTTLRKLLILVFVLAVGAFVWLPAPAYAVSTKGVNAWHLSGASNQGKKCEDLDNAYADGGTTWYELKFDPKYDPSKPEAGVGPLQLGTQTIGSFTVEFLAIDPTGVSFKSNLPVDAVMVKNGVDGAFFYVYDGLSANSDGALLPNGFVRNSEEDQDSNLTTPGPAVGGNFQGISHVSFCLDYEVVVTKTANTSFTRTFGWTIDKSVTPEAWDLFTGDTGTSQYTVAVTKDAGIDSAWAVSGNISVFNPAPAPATITGVTDEISGVGPVTPNCGVTFPYSLAAGGTLTCSYGPVSLLNADSRTNTATATTSGAVGGGTGTAAVDFASATINKVNDTITVDDSVQGPLGSFADSGSTTYNRTFACDGDEGPHDNTATINQTGQSDSASVTVKCYDLTVTKDAATSLTRTWNWTIAKSVSPETVDMFTGDSGTVQYTVAVDKVDFTDSAWAVSGNISVKNNHPNKAARINGVADLISSVVDPATVACKVDDVDVVFPYDLAASQTLACTYSKPGLPDAADRTNTATATLQNNAYDKDLNATPNGTTDFTGSAAVSFANATITEINPAINVSDTNGESWEPVGDDASWTYPRTFTCDSDDGTHGNTATIVETGASDDASVTVNCYALAVTKTAVTSLTRSWNWTIDKSADQSDLTLAVGQTFLVNYVVTVGATSVDSAWAVSGNIVVNNPAPIPATINGVADVVSPDITAAVDCGVDVAFPYALAAGGTLNCTYSAPLPDAADRINTATATLQNTPSGTTDFTGSANVVFDAATVVNHVDECIDVTDDKGGTLGTVCANELPMAFAYSLTVGPYDTCGEYEFVNVASFVSNDTGATSSASWTVKVNVPCGGCTLTQGYWKTHSAKGPAPYDDTWAQIGEDTTFFLSGKSYYEVMWTPPAGNAYYNLAHQYIAAVLNGLNGASSTPAVDTALATAKTLFEAKMPAQIAALKGNDKLRKQFVDLAATLAGYNEGLTGPGHCDEDVSSASFGSTDDQPKVFIPLVSVK